MLSMQRRKERNTTRITMLLSFNFNGPSWMMSTVLIQVGEIKIEDNVVHVITGEEILFEI